MQDSTIALKRPDKRAARPLLSRLHDRKVRGVLLQLLLAALLLWLGYVGVSNAVANLKAANIASGFGFLASTAGFDINQSLIPYSGATSTYGDAFVVGLLNTLLVAAIGIVLATLIGFLVGIARLSSNVVVAAVATLYVETLRNLPLLLQIFFWYSAVLVALPAARESLHLADWVFLNNRGLYLPFVNIDGPAWPLWLALALAVLGYALARRLALRARLCGGRSYPARTMALGLFVVVLGAGCWLSTRRPRSTCPGSAVSALRAASGFIRRWSPWWWPCPRTPRPSSRRSCARASARWARGSARRRSHWACRHGTRNRW